MRLRVCSLHAIQGSVSACVSVSLMRATNQECEPRAGGRNCVLHEGVRAWASRAPSSCIAGQSDSTPLLGGGTSHHAPMSY
eukprot:6188387-Pleurochrysis_carterae.AAC.1